MGRVDAALAELKRVTENPTDYVRGWKARSGMKAIGILPMNFPPELVYAAGALPVLVQESDVPITLGRNLIFEFYCGYTRSLVDQAATHQLDDLDGIFLVDHCVALLGAVDAMRYAMPDMPIFLAQFVASMDEDWSPPQVREKIEMLSLRLAELCGNGANEERLRRSISLYNRDRQLLRKIYDLRRARSVSVSAAEMQVLVKSAMLMDIEEHVGVIADLAEHLLIERPPVPDDVRVHFSGHFCHAPKPELLALIEECGATVVDDDLFTGFRYISTDVPEGVDALGDLTRWYFDRNNNAPCSTRAQKSVDWEDYLLTKVTQAGAQGVIVLMPKFCEPHMLYYPELRQALLENGVPHLLLETEHEGLPIETVRVRVEGFIEMIKQRQSAVREYA